MTIFDELSWHKRPICRSYWEQQPLTPIPNSSGKYRPGSPAAKYEAAKKIWRNNKDEL